MIRSRACTFRYRVIEVIGGHESDWGAEKVMTVFPGSGKTREFKTLKAASAYRDRLAGESRWPVLLQVGGMQWFSEEEAQIWAEQHIGEFWE